jgi:hypothetical protein
MAWAIWKMTDVGIFTRATTSAGTTAVPSAPASGMPATAKSRVKSWAVCHTATTLA